MQTIIFDVDDTLYDQLLPFQKTVHLLIDASFPEAEMGAFYKTSRKYSDEVFEKHMNGEITGLELQTYRIMKACEDYQIKLSYEDAVRFQEVYLQEQRKIQLFHPMKHLLEQLAKQNIRLAVLTNGELNHQMMKVEQLGLTNWIPAEHIFVSGDVGCSKPDIQVFEHLENKLNLEKEQTLYIGDSYHHDVIGAKNAGWQVAWLNHRNRELPEHRLKPDYIAEKPDDILSIVNEWCHSLRKI
ncbi:HAD family hydrolase [Gracilibacillus sp. S3-1-1]|uniref:HAD family hydrolase n=1 Tax=Gracilibacillus pellucidus TaxID=3095368 RepID=A0ACC6M2U4_9BACI|nr:HAD family hydrolase [Gracilibacillus sp. S3-1-1]MDX8045244.1 HAD family hydrolase [Gracilibacillus sp. S3-1-1]